MVGANFESLVSSHNQSSFAVLFVLEQTDVTGASLFPFSRVPVELEEFGSHLENLLFSFFVSLGLDLLGQMYDRFEGDIGFLLICFVLPTPLVVTLELTSSCCHLLHRRHQPFLLCCYHWARP